GSNWSPWTSSKYFTTTGGGGGCNAPAVSQINSSNVGSTTVSLNYTGSEDFSIFQYKVAGSSTFTIANYSSTGVTNLSGLTAGTQYEYQGGIWCGSNWSPWTSSKYFTTTGGGGGNAYCNSNGNTTSDEWINRVQFGGINNTSGNNGGYANYTGTSTVVNANTNVSWTLVPGFSSSVYSEYWTIWIDFNQDGDFNDSGEMVSQGNGTSTITGSAYIPSNVPSGSTRMRVSMKYNGYSSPCESFQYGEVEDYTIVIGSAMPEGVNSFIQNKNILGIHPNPAMEYVQLDFNANSSGEALVELVNLTGRTVKLLHKEVLEGENILRLNLSDLPEGTYIVQIKTGKEKFVGKIAVVR
uniref:GEVED domain-containing protein n=1 Tax=Lewinella sp. TaxID=2004506 RepID=UPI003D6B2ADA